MVQGCSGSMFTNHDPLKSSKLFPRLAHTHAHNNPQVCAGRRWRWDDWLQDDRRRQGPEDVRGATGQNFGQLDTWWSFPLQLSSIIIFSFYCCCSRFFSGMIVRIQLMNREKPWVPSTSTVLSRIPDLNCLLVYFRYLSFTSVTKISWWVTPTDMDCHGFHDEPRLLTKEVNSLFKKVATLYTRCKPGRVPEFLKGCRLGRWGTDLSHRGYHINVKISMSSKDDMNFVQGQIGVGGHTEAGELETAWNGLQSIAMHGKPSTLGGSG